MASSFFLWILKKELFFVFRMYVEKIVRKSIVLSKAGWDPLSLVYTAFSFPLDGMLRNFSSWFPLPIRRGIWPSFF